MRPASPDDRAAADLLYESAAPYYDAFAGGERSARRMMQAVFAHPGHTASFSVCRVALTGAEIAGVLAAFPSRECERLGRRFLQLGVPRIPLWHWPRVIRHLRAASSFTPVPPAGTLYVDALAVAEGRRRRGIATELLATAESMAREAGLGAVALDTGLENDGAQALYERLGFQRRGERHAPDERTARAVGGAGFVSYLRPLHPQAHQPAAPIQPRE